DQRVRFRATRRVWRPRPRVLLSRRAGRRGLPNDPSQRPGFGGRIRLRLRCREAHDAGARQLHPGRPQDDRLVRHGRRERPLADLGRDRPGWRGARLVPARLGRGTGGEAMSKRMIDARGRLDTDHLRRVAETHGSETLGQIADALDALRPLFDRGVKAPYRYVQALKEAGFWATSKRENYGHRNYVTQFYRDADH